MRTAMVPLPVAAVLTGGTSWLPLRMTFEPLLETAEAEGEGLVVWAHAAARNAAAPRLLTQRDRLTICRSACIGSVSGWLLRNLWAASPALSPHLTLHCLHCAGHPGRNRCASASIRDDVDSSIAIRFTPCSSAFRFGLGRSPWQPTRSHSVRGAYFLPGQYTQAMLESLRPDAATWSLRDA